MELGKKIRQLRFKAGLTQEQLADQLGISAQSVSKWENNVAMPDITSLPLLAEIFGISIDDLFDLTNEQRLNRIENSLDITEELPQDLFREYEDFLKSQLSDKENAQRSTSLLAYLYWHRMNPLRKKQPDTPKIRSKMPRRPKTASGCCSALRGMPAGTGTLSTIPKPLNSGAASSKTTRRPVCRTCI